MEGELWEHGHLSTSCPSEGVKPEGTCAQCTHVHTRACTCTRMCTHVHGHTRVAARVRTVHTCVGVCTCVRQLTCTPGLSENSFRKKECFK